jgi:hypothetical protein
VQHDRLAGVEEAEGCEIPDGGGGCLGVEQEVELLDRAQTFEARRADSAFERGGGTTGDLVLTDHLEELDVVEFTGFGLGQASFEGVEHA